MRRPKRVHVRSLSDPMMGCTTSPMSGGSIQKKLRLWGSAPSVEKIRLMLALCSAYAICTPKNPKLRLKSLGNDWLGIVFIDLV